MPPKKTIVTAKQEIEEQMHIICNTIVNNSYAEYSNSNPYLDNLFRAIKSMRDNKKEVKAVASTRLQELHDEEEKIKEEVEAYFHSPLTPREERRYIIDLQKDLSTNQSFSDTGK